MSTLTIRLSDSSTEAEAQDARLKLALKLFEDGHISSSKAAEIAGYTRRDFIKVLNDHGLSIFNYPPEEIESDVENARRASHFGHQLSDRPA
jgi:predicted HTH domain antitoxin